MALRGAPRAWQVLGQWLVTEPHPQPTGTSSKSFLQLVAERVTDLKQEEALLPGNGGSRKEERGGLERREQAQAAAHGQTGTSAATGPSLPKPDWPSVSPAHSHQGGPCPAQPAAAALGDPEQIGGARVRRHGWKTTVGRPQSQTPPRDGDLSCLGGRPASGCRATCAHRPTPYLFAWPQLVPPLLQVLVMALVQGLQLLRFVLHQEVTLFILEQTPGGTGVGIRRN